MAKIIYEDDKLYVTLLEDIEDVLRTQENPFKELYEKFESSGQNISVLPFDNRPWGYIRIPYNDEKRILFFINNNKVNGFEFFNKYPELKNNINEFLGDSNLYDMLIRIVKGDVNGIDWYSLTRQDANIGDFRFNENNPGKSSISITFNSTEDFLNLFPLSGSDKQFIENIVSNNNYGYRIFDEYYSTKEDWSEGYIVKNWFNDDQKIKLSEILERFAPELNDIDENSEKISEELYDRFQRDIDDIITEISSAKEKSNEDEIRESIEEVLCDKLSAFGFIQKYCFSRYITTPVLLIKLYDKIGVKTLSIFKLLQELCKSVDVDSLNNIHNEYYDYLNYDTSKYDNDISRVIDNTLDTILDKLEDETEYKDINEYKKIRLELSRKYKFNEWYAVPKKQTRKFLIKTINPETNEIEFNVKMEDGTTGKTEMSLEEFNKFLYQPELFESFLKIGIFNVI